MQGATTLVSVWSGLGENEGWVRESRENEGIQNSEMMEI